MVFHAEVWRPTAQVKKVNPAFDRLIHVVRSRRHVTVSKAATGAGLPRQRLRFPALRKV